MKKREKSNVWVKVKIIDFRHGSPKFVEGDFALYKKNSTAIPTANHSEMDMIIEFAYKVIGKVKSFQRFSKLCNSKLEFFELVLLSGGSCDESSVGRRAGFGSLTGSVLQRSSSHAGVNTFQ